MARLAVGVGRPRLAKNSPRPVERTGHTFLRCLGGQSETPTNLLCRPPLEIAPEDDVAFSAVQLGQRLVEMRRNMLPKSIRVSRSGVIHGGGFLFPKAAAFFTANGIDSDVTSGFIEPAR